VQRTADALALHFNERDVQSEMRLDAPNALQFDYTKLMMGYLLLAPLARTLCMVGLGGGSLPKFCHHYLLHTHTTVLEISPEVIALRDDFAVPPDGPRFAVECVDAVDYLANTTQRFDVLLVDGFDASGLPAALCTPQFYADCHDVLAEGGVAVFNLHRNDTLFPLFAERLRAPFDDAVVLVDDTSATNTIAFACADAAALKRVAPAFRKPKNVPEDVWAPLAPWMQAVHKALQQRRHVDGLRDAVAALHHQGG